MKNATAIKASFKKLGINATATVIQSTRDYLETNGFINGAKTIFKELLDRDVSFTDDETARVHSMALVDVLKVNNFKFESVEAVEEAVANRIQAFEANVAKHGIKKSTKVVQSSRRGKAPNSQSKQQQVFALYPVEVVGNKMPNNLFVKLIAEKFNMSIQGARTYATNARNFFEKSTKAA